MKNMYNLYKVKRNTFTWLGSLLLFLMLGTSCSEEDSSNIPPDEEGSTAYLNVNTRAFGNGDKRVSTARIIIAKQDFGGTIISNRFFSDPADSTIIIKTFSGRCDVFVITNEMPDKTQLSSLSAVKTVNELKRINIPHNITNRVATNLPMMGKVQNVFIRPAANDAPSETNLSTVVVDGIEYTSLKVAVNRIAVKLTLDLMSKSFAALESVQIIDIPDSISLFGNAYTGQAANKQSIVMPVGEFTSQAPLTGYIWEMRKDEVYIPSNMFTPSTDATNAIKLEVKQAGKTKKTIALGHLIEASQETKDYTLHQNTHYTFTGRIIGDNLEINAAIANWDLDKQDYPTGGGKWELEPEVSQRIGINTANGGKAEFKAQFKPAPDNYQWYRRFQRYNPETNKIETVVVPFDDIDTDALTVKGGYTGTLSIRTKKIDVSGEIYCIASTTSPDGTVERSESKKVTLMVVGENYAWPKGSFPSMQSFKAPLNVPLGSTCILQDDREEDGRKVYHVKLMADGNWWMIQDLAYGNVVSKDVYIRDCQDATIKNILGAGLYGLGMASELVYGGYWYNSFIHQVEGVKSDVPRYGNKGVHKSFIQGICPSGWHIPGNMDDEYNKELTLFVEKLNLDLTSVDGLSKFDYTNPYSFNAYTILGDMDADLKGSISFRGGYFAQLISPSFNLYGTQGLTTAADYGGVMIEIDYNSWAAIPMRCVKNFK